MRLFFIISIALLFSPSFSEAELELKKLGAMDPEKERTKPKEITPCFAGLDVKMGSDFDNMMPIKEYLKQHGGAKNQSGSPCGTDEAIEKKEKELVSDPPIADGKDDLKKSTKTAENQSNKKSSESSKPGDTTEKQKKQKSITKKLK